MYASGTTLGADNGIGIAAAFAVLEDKSLKHGPIEVLITCDEETTMEGAQHLDPTVLKAKYLINVDSEEEYSICVGCAGGLTTYTKIALNRTPVEGHSALKVVISGLKGGHTGVDIDKGRCNAMKVMARCLKSVKAAPIRLISFDCGT
jgi:dipeptidase D